MPRQVKKNMTPWHCAARTGDIRSNRDFHCGLGKWCFFGSGGMGFSSHIRQRERKRNRKINSETRSFLLDFAPDSSNYPRPSTNLSNQQPSIAACAE